MKILISKKRNIIFLIVCIVLVAVAIKYVVPYFTLHKEVSTIAVNVKDFNDAEERFTLLAEEKGAVYAFEVLQRVELPPNFDLHLLGHAIGYELYKQKGVKAIADCTHHFRNACSHTIVIGALNEYGGESALDLIREACKKAPGGRGAYTMCYHGLGHGVFAYYGYDIQETVAFCQKTGTPEYRNREGMECVGGMIMELMGGGGHDREAWLKSRQKYLSKETPLAPCSTSLIPEEAKSMCYTYLTPHLFDTVGANMGSPQPKDFTEAFLLCDAITKKDTRSRKACFGGIGKEFPVLALSRDIRNVDKATIEQLRLMNTWCALAPHTEAYRDCYESIVGSLFWGGENDPAASINFCSAVDDNEQQNCFSNLFVNVKAYLPKEHLNYKTMCSRIPTEFETVCRQQLSLIN